MRRTTALRKPILLTASVLATLSLAVASPARAQQLSDCIKISLNPVDFASTAGTCVKNLIRTGTAGVSLLRDLAGSSMRNLVGLLKDAAKTLTCVAKGAVTYIPRALTHPIDSMKATLANVWAGMKKVPGLAMKDLIKGGSDIVRRMTSYGKRVIGTASALSLDKLSDLLLGWLDEGWGFLKGRVRDFTALAFNTLAGFKDIYPFGCLQNLRPAAQKLEAIIIPMMDLVIGAIKKVLKEAVVPIFEQALEKVVSSMLGEVAGAMESSMKDAVVGRLIELDRVLADLTRGGQADAVTLTPSVRDTLLQRLAEVPVLKPSFAVEVIKKAAVSLVNKALELSRSALKTMLMWSLGGVFKSQMHKLFGWVVGTMVPASTNVTVEQVVSGAAVGTVGVAGVAAPAAAQLSDDTSLFTGNLGEIVWIVLWTLWDVGVRDYLVDKPIDTFLEMTVDFIGKKLVSLAADLVARPLGATLDATMGSATTKLATLVPLPGPVSKVLGKLLQWWDKSAPATVQELRAHTEEVRGLIVDLSAKKNAKVCLPRIPKAPEPPLGTLTDLLGIVTGKVMDKLLQVLPSGNASGGTTSSTSGVAPVGGAR